MFNKDNIDTFKGSRLNYTTLNNGNRRKYILKSVDRVAEDFATVKVIDIRPDSTTGQKHVFKTIHFVNIALSL